MFRIKRFKMLLSFALFVTSSATFANECPDPRQFISQITESSTSHASKTLSEFKEYEKVLNLLTTDGAKHEGSGLKVVMAALELGKVKGLKNLAGKPLNIAEGGVSAVMNDIAHYYPKMMAQQKNGELTMVGILMDGMSTKGMTHVRNIQVPIEDHLWTIGIHEYKSPDGIKYVFLDNPSFKRFTAMPDKAVALDQNVYTLRGLEEQTRANQLEEQRIWSAINQGIADVVTHEKAHIYMPHDNHVAPASFYIHQNSKKKLLATKPLVHNEEYVGNYWVPDDEVESVRKIWNLKPHEMQEYFMHGDQLMMMAPAVRLAEQNEIYSALSVSEGTAQGINGIGSRPRTQTKIDFFDRVGELTNGLGVESRPHLSSLLKQSTLEDLTAEGITHPEVVAQFMKREGYSLADHATPKQVAQWKAESKRALQLNYGMTVDPNKPMFISFARMVKQKGMKFVAENVEHILQKGGQVIVGGPVGDAIGAAERKMFLKLQKKFAGTAYEKDFVFIDGAVMGRPKGLTLAGGDFFLIPSRFEPCGLTDCEALYHGVIPIAHDTGGLNKGKETILYRPLSPDDQGWQLGEAINHAFDEFSDVKKFKRRQVHAMKQNFSVEQNFGRFLGNYRVEVYGKMLKEVDRLVANHSLTESAARRLIQDKVLKAHPMDVPNLIEGLKMVHPSRRTPSMSWLIESQSH